MTKRIAAERALRGTIRTDLASWARYVLAPLDQAPAAHHLEIIKALEAVCAGETERLMLLLPPGSAKSTYASKLFPAWWLARHPTASVITACHTVGLAESFGRSVRLLVTEHGARLNLFLRPDARAAGRFLTEQGGEYFAVGVGGAVTGRRADLALIDDPVRNAAEADSKASRDRLWNWYRSELLTRLKPHGRVVLVMTRWHTDDLAGRLLEQDGWRCIRLPALAEENDPMGRALGEALWPGWEGRDALLAKQAALGERSFASLFQQAPLTAGGTLFDVTKMRPVDIVPAGVTVRAWDLAAGHDVARDPDWTAGVKLTSDGRGLFWVDDVRRVRAAPADVERLIVETAARDGEAVTVSLARDPGQAGQYQVMMLTRALAGYRVRASPEIGSKQQRAEPVAAQVNQGNVMLRRGAWNREFLEEIALFPNGTKDDQVDALSRAFALLTGGAKPARFTSVPYLAR